MPPAALMAMRAAELLAQQLDVEHRGRPRPEARSTSRPCRRRRRGRRARRGGCGGRRGATSRPRPAPAPAGDRSRASAGATARTIATSSSRVSLTLAGQEPVQPHHHLEVVRAVDQRALGGGGLHLGHVGAERERDHRHDLHVAARQAGRRPARRAPAARRARRRDRRAPRHTPHRGPVRLQQGVGARTPPPSQALRGVAPSAHRTAGRAPARTAAPASRWIPRCLYAMQPRSPLVDFDDFIQRDREAEIAKIRSRRAERDQMRKVFRRRRAIAVAVLALPIAGFVFAGKFPSDNKKAAAKTTSAPAATTAAAAATTDRGRRRALPGAVRGARRALLDVPRQRPERDPEVHRGVRPGHRSERGRARHQERERRHRLHRGHAVAGDQVGRREGLLRAARDRRPVACGRLLRDRPRSSRSRTTDRRGVRVEARDPHAPTASSGRTTPGSAG